jgi:hypothetical protein
MEATQMNCFDHVVDLYHDAKDRIIRFLDSEPNLMRVHFNLTEGNRTWNYHGIVPALYFADDDLYPGLVKVLAIAGIKPGWKKGAAVFPEDAPLLELAFGLIASAKAKPAARRRRSKA